LGGGGGCKRFKTTPLSEKQLRALQAGRDKLKSLVIECGNAVSLEMADGSLSQDIHGAICMSGILTPGMIRNPIIMRWVAKIIRARHFGPYVNARFEESEPQICEPTIHIYQLEKGENRVTFFQAEHEPGDTMNITWSTGLTRTYSINFARILYRRYLAKGFTPSQEVNV
jgi:hypothetical protein